MNNKLKLGRGRIVGTYADKGQENGKWFNEFHDTPENYAAFLSECKRVLKPSAHLYIMFDSFSLLTLGPLVREYKETNKDIYCIFIAPAVSEATLAHYYNLHKTNIAYYGGKAKIIPLDLETFLLILQRAYSADDKPSSANLKRFVSKATEWAHNSADEVDWFSKIKQEAMANF